MAAEIPANFCANCLCPGCVAVSRKLWEIQQQVAAELAERQAAIQTRRDRKQAQRAELMQQGAMIWMLTNHAKDSAEAFQIMNWLGSIFDISSGMVNARRNIYVVELNRRAGIVDEFQWKPPGTRGMDEPSRCEKCGGLKSSWKRCARRSCH